MKVKFKVQHQILSGLKYLQVVKRRGISQKSQEMIGSYGPNKADAPVYEKKCMIFALNSCGTSGNILLVDEEDAPSGLLARGHYNAVSKFVDDDNVTHLMFEWSFDIKKEW